MSTGVNPKRRYDSQRRREQADATRQVILAAARRLFDEGGYAATTMAALATEAGVALKTVYLGFETKAGVVRALWDVSLRGERDLAVANQEWYREVLEAPDAERALRLNARNARAVKIRISAVLQIIRTGALSDPELDALWRHIQDDFHANPRVIVEKVHDSRALRRDLDVAHATDILWTLNHPDVWQLLVHQRGWTPQEWEAWFGDTSCSQLLEPGPPASG